MTALSPNILIVDDEANVRFILENALKHQGYALHVAGCGREAIDLMNTHTIDVMLLDLQMEPMNGVEVFTAARQRDPLLVVIILTGYGTLESAVEAVRLGAFDYLFKPASPATIRQRVLDGVRHRQQLLRQQQLLSQLDTLRETLARLDDTQSSPSVPPAAGRFVRQGGLVLDCHHRQATLHDTLLELTTTEFDLLVCLARHAPQPLSARQLVNCALGYDTDDNTAKELMKWHIYQLRRKIEPVPRKPRYIKNVRHKGYMWSTA